MMAIDESRFEISPASAAAANVVNLTGDTLILPSVSIGSVPQLAIDALLDSQNAQKIFGQSATFIGSLDHRFCFPFLGGASGQTFEKEKPLLQSPMQLYRFPQAKLTILQQRSPILKSRKGDFVTKLMSWIQEKGFADVIILTSIDAGLRIDSQMNSLFWYLDSGVQGDSRISSKLQTTLSVFQGSSTRSTSILQIPTKKNNIPALPSGGLAQRYMKAAVDHLQNTPAHALITFVAEGDNRFDALSMASLLIDLLSLSSLSAEQFHHPRDWNLVFGPFNSDSMYT